MPVSWEDTARALEAIAAKVAAVDKRIERDGGKLVQTAIMLEAPTGPTGNLRAGITIGSSYSGGGGVGAGHVAVGPTGRYGRRISLGYHGTDSLGRGPYHQRGNPYVTRADEKSALLVHELASRHWQAAIGG